MLPVSFSWLLVKAMKKLTPADCCREIPPTAGLPLVWRDLLPSNTALAEAMAAFLQVEAVSVECSGTAALVVALTTLRQRSPRRIVIVPAYTCPLVALAIKHCGLTLKLCDLAADSFDFDFAQLQQLCDHDTLAVIPTHLAGRVADVAQANAIAHAVGAWVIEDAAQALGARHQGKSVGLAGDIAFFSLAAGKGLSIYEGGILIARDPELRAALQQTSQQIIPSSFLHEAKRCLELLGYAALYGPRGLWLAYGEPLRRALRRGDWVEAVGDDFPEQIPLHRVGRWRQGVACKALRRLSEFQSDIQQQAQRRSARLQQIDGIQVMGDTPGNDGVWPFLLLLLPSEQARDLALQKLWGAGLGVSRLFIHALPDYAYLSSCVPAAEVPNARDFARRSLSISNSPWLDDRSFEQIVAVLQGCSEPQAAA